MRNVRIFVVLVVLAATMGLMGSAFGQEGSAELPGDTVQDKFFNRGETRPGEDVLGTRFPGQRGESALPFTGSDLTLFVVAGLVAVGAGAAFVRRTRDTAVPTKTQV
ncbi:hypothetical protein BH24ACT26_BH24ACT26_05060 [soil metagenome]